jgi:D-3-phosphoglycerate dehydrogenase
MKVVVADQISEKGVQFLHQQKNIEVVCSPDLPPAQLKEHLKDAKGLIVRSKTRVTQDILDSAPALQVIGRAGAGVDTIDLDTATKRGILVMNTPGGNSVSAAEHAFALMITLARKITLADASMRSGKWEKSRFTGQELQNKTLGILGLGKIGTLLAQRGLGFQMEVVAYDPFISQEYSKDLGVRLVEAADVFRKADFLSLHLPLTDDTRGIVNNQSLSRMKNSAFLINAARGGLVVEEDLAQALETGTIAGAALDVFENEPKISERMRSLKNSILTPHIAGATIEAQDQVGVSIARQVIDYLKDGLVINAVNFPSLSVHDLKHVTPFLQLGKKLGGFAIQTSSIGIDEIGIRYYGGLQDLDYRPISNHILKAILQPMLSEPVNEVNARTTAAQRGINVVETLSSRPRGHSELISIQLRNSGEIEWVEGAILHDGQAWLISVNGIAVETQLDDFAVFIRNEDKPGVIGQVGTILGKSKVNISSFVLGRSDSESQAIGVINTDSEVEQGVIEEICSISAVSFARIIRL